MEVGAYKGTFGDTACDGCAWASGAGPVSGDHAQGLLSAHQELDDCDDAWMVYRRVLAAQPDHSVTIASIGMLTNLYLLFRRSEGDEYSPLSGIDLVAQKMEKVVYMDGGYNFGCAAGYVGETSACDGNAEFVVENWPANVTQYFMDAGGR